MTRGERRLLLAWLVCFVGYIISESRLCYDTAMPNLAVFVLTFLMSWVSPVWLIWSLLRPKGTGL